MQKKIKVKPNTIQSIKEADGSLSVSLKSSPVDGKANEELIKLLAQKFNVPKATVYIKLCFSYRQKLVEIDGDR